ncbi:MULTISPECIES: glutathionylspermidine synthase family protein [Bacillus]|uniref:glutathionylspermidine synthase family protein n=1 Tax=Bacillus TaxID=1386 RepID=UPI002452859E|nr:MULTISPECIES: glutathionylspermidine synthase family protein [Bacillus]MDH3081269.1 glutathionylspermidine synthase family protein [Bacillus amyloliquefaciens]MDU0074646.1 glutathionylspermidine synthase family protein [Bacillus sp. IG2]MDU0100356.1 glutathionylspermidine synthase family protein [Bacillus sp. IS1]MEC2272981.1 glutathionylspermidine synthase family protein [Bacillus velezensis]MED3677450.1 glutathionylspermidine synthase family protein [Bacillus velezensis]
MIIPNEMYSIDQRKMKQGIEEKQIFFDGKTPIPVSLTPFLIDRCKYDHLKSKSELVLEAMEIFLRIYIEYDDIQEEFPELSVFRELSRIKPLYKHWIHLARFDVAETIDGRFKLMETNCDCPGAILWVSYIKQIYETLDIFKEISNKYEINAQATDDPQLFIRSLIDVYKEVNGKKQDPNIGFLSSEYHPVLTDLDLLEKLATTMGLSAKHISIQKLQSVDNLPGWGNKPLQMAFHKFDAFIDENDQFKYCLYEGSVSEIEKYWNGLKNNQFIYVNSFPSALVAENKRILYLLKDKHIQSFFSKEQKDAIDMLIPETFSLTSQKPEQIKEVINNKDQYVLKRVIDTRGRGVILGKFCPNDLWNRHVSHAIDKPFIMQKYIDQSKKTIIKPNGDPIPISVYQSLALYLVKGKASGLLCRSSIDPITNVGKRGAVQPAYVISEREI